MYERTVSNENRCTAFLTALGQFKICLKIPKKEDPALLPPAHGRCTQCRVNSRLLWAAFGCVVRAPGCAKPLPQDRRERYCRKAACLQASKEARLAREAASIKKAADKQAAAEARLARLKKKLKPAKPVFVALLPMQNDRRAQAVDPTDWAAMEQAAAHWCRVKDEQNAKERCAAWCSILIATLTRSPAGLALEPRHLLGVGRLLRRARRRRLRLRR